MENTSPITTQDKTAGRRDAPPKLAHTIPEAVLASGISRSTLYLAISRGTLDARKCGARTLILDSELRRFLGSLPRLTKGEPRPESAE
jgi:hypothetical protein